MNDANGASDTAMRPHSRSVLTPEVIVIVTVGIALGTLFLTTTGRIETQLDASNARLDKAISESADERRAFQEQAANERRAFQSEAAADRRAFQGAMDEFRKRMDEFRGDIRRLGERQAHLEGQREGAAGR